MKLNLATNLFLVGVYSVQVSEAFAPSIIVQRKNAASVSLKTSNNDDSSSSRRNFINAIGSASAAIFTLGNYDAMSVANAETGGGDFNVDDFLKSGQVAMPMGVSGQAGKSKPETGIVFRDGSEVSRDSRTGDVLTEILLNARSDDPIATLATFSSPWPIAKGSVYDVECRDANTGDSAFLSVSNAAKGKAISDLPNSFFLDKLFSSNGRFSFYGPPTDIKVKKSYMEGNNRIIELSFSILSQSTGSEIPRNAIVAATIPQGTDEAVMLVGSSTANRWKKGSEAAIRKTIDSFKAIPAPKSSMKVRAKVDPRTL
mmetsp:Transcript_17972/g.20779  ORF Transcript_17972/g.20779 Transcript_17972/m.20779 type:complete len:314 (+) Transcript_17972:90-1031(+)